MWRAVPKGERGTSPSRPSTPRSWCSVVLGVAALGLRGKQAQGRERY